MGLEDVEGVDPDSDHDKYYTLTRDVQAVVEYPGFWEDLPRDIRNVIHNRAEYREEVVSVKVPMRLEGHGYTEKEALEAVREKEKMIEDHEFDNEYAEVVNIEVRKEDMEQNDLE